MVTGGLQDPRPDRDGPDWSALAAELDAWAEAGRTATFWWRDDDATGPVPELARLLGLAERFELPLSLAVIPSGAQAELKGALNGATTLLLHGATHANHAAPGQKKCELAAGRDTDEMLAELGDGLARLEGLYGEAVLPVLVPPWNRIADGLVPRLGEIGLKGLSRYRPRKSPLAAPGLGEVNTHLDPIDWHAGRGFIGEARLVADIVAHLQARRADEVDAQEPTGLLTHHMALDEAGWAALFRLFDETGRHDAARWIPCRAAFALIDGLEDGLDAPPSPPPSPPSGPGGGEEQDGW